MTFLSRKQGGQYPTRYNRPFYLNTLMILAALFALIFQLAPRSAEAQTLSPSVVTASSTVASLHTQQWPQGLYSAFAASQPQQKPKLLQTPELTAADGNAGDQFAAALNLAANGTVAIIGAPFHQVGNNAAAGAAYIFVKDSSGNWTRATELNGAAADDQFGTAVSLSADGSTAVVGAPNHQVGNNAGAGTAYVYSRGNSNNWTQSATLTASDNAAGDALGTGSSLSPDGNTALVGADGRSSSAGAAYIFSKGSNGSWSQVSRLTATDGAANNQLGFSASLSGDGSTALVGAAATFTNSVGSGAAYIFVKGNNGWSASQTQTAKLSPSDGGQGDQFGFTVSLSFNGGVAMVGAIDHKVGNNATAGEAYVYSRGNNNSYSQSAILRSSDQAAGDQFGYVVSLTSDGNTALIGAQGHMVNGNANAGSGYIFKYSGTTWNQFTEITAYDPGVGDNYGNTGGISSDGNTALFGAPVHMVGTNASAGDAYAYVLNQPTNELTASDNAANDQFGAALNLSANGNVAIAGAPFHQVGNNAAAGAAYIYVKNPNGWTQAAELTAPDGAADDQFGTSVSLSNDGSTAIVGAPNHQVGNNAAAGATYVFTKGTGNTWTLTATLTASDGAANDNLGLGGSLSLDGNTAIVGAGGRTNGAGAAYVFVKGSNGSWSQTALLTAAAGVANNQLGFSVNLSGDGNTVIVGAAATLTTSTTSGAAYIFTKASGSSWSNANESVKLTPSDGATGDQYGFTVSLSYNGGVAMVGAIDHNIGANAKTGETYVYNKSNNYSQTVILHSIDQGAGDQFGYSVSLSSDGNTALIGAQGHTVNGNANAGSGYVFKYDGTTWNQISELTGYDEAANDNFGNTDSLSSDGKTAVFGAPVHMVGNNASAGAIYTFNLNQSYTYNLPLLANNATTALGRTTTFITFQNLSGVSGANINVQYYDINTGSVTTYQDSLSLAAKGQHAILPAIPSGSSYGGIVTSSQPLNLVVSESLNAGGSAYNVTASTASTLYSPLALNGHYGFTTTFVVFNAGNTTSTGTISFYDENGNAVTGANQTFNIPPHASQTFNQAANGSNLTNQFSYWAKIAATNPGDSLTAQVIEFGPSNFVATFNALVSSQVSTKIYAPATFNGKFGFVTGMQLTNPNGAAANGSVIYYDSAGNQLASQPFNIPAFGTLGVFQGPSGANAPTNTTSAVINSNQPLVTTINERGPSNVSGTYVGLTSGSTNVALPVMADGFAGFITGATVLNVGSNTAHITFSYLSADTNAQIGASQTVTLAPNASFLVYQGDPTQGLPGPTSQDPFFGTALLSSDQPLLVTTNALNTSNGLFYTYTEPSR